MNEINTHAYNIHNPKIQGLVCSILELCQETSLNETSPCNYWTFLPTLSKCFILETCNEYDNPEATSGQRNCPPGDIISASILLFTYLVNIVIYSTKYVSLVLSCPEKGVSCVPSCDSSSVKTMDNVTNQRQCASMEEYT